MARKIKQYSRKELLKEQDEFLSLTEQSIEWSRANWPILIIALGIIAVAGVVGLLIRSSTASAKQEFQASLEEAISTYNAPVEGQGMPPTQGIAIYPDQKQKYDAAVFKFDKLVKENSGSNLVPYMRTYLAGASLNQGDYDKAIQEYGAIIQSVNPDSDLATIARHNQAIAYYLKGKYDQAYPIFKELAEGKTPLEKASAIVYAARCAEQLGKADEALKYYQRAVDSYSDSFLTNGLKEKIARLKMSSPQPQEGQGTKVTPQPASTQEPQ